MKTVDEFLASVEANEEPPVDMDSRILALWLARKDRWDASHDVAQDISSSDGSWIHAYLHRVEGDLGNARYWYSRAGKPAKGGGESLDDEWREISKAILGNLHG